jgi:hypothetical protein
MEISGSANVAPYAGSARASAWESLKSASASIQWVDVVAVTCILCLGALQFFVSQRAPGFQRDDVFYADAGRSILQHGWYGINGHAETNQPPGLPAFLALLCLAGSCTHIAFLRAMAVFETLGFLLTYQLLRYRVSRPVAASICLLLISSRIFFLMATQWVFPSYPYFFFSTSALWVATKFERAETTVARVVWGALLTLLIATSLMFASAGMAFLCAILASTAALFFRSRQRAFARMKLYFAVFLIGAAVQGLWMHRKPATLEWPIPGYPQSYLSQLKVKSGNEPELGLATLRDIPRRVLRNAADDGVMLSQALLHRWVDVAWMSVLVTGPIALILLGWGTAVWRTGGSLLDWYFAAYQSLYLLWPWNMETRFFLPIAPLACYYLWRGATTLVVLAKHRPRLVALAWYPLGVILAVSSWFWMHGSWIASHMTHAGLQDESSFVIWVLSSVIAVRMLWAESSWLSASSSIRRWLSLPSRFFGLSPLRIVRYGSLAAVVLLILTGLGAQLKLARTNLDPNSLTNSMPPDVLAGQWINSHTDANAIIMARHLPIVYHYAERKIVWFPPSSNPQLLMEGIQKHKIDFVVVVTRNNSYYLPPEEDCMAALLPAYPNAFDLVYQSEGFKIYRTVKNTERSQLVSSEPLR